MRVVVSLTTIPSRVPYIYKILYIIRSQTYPIDKIYLNLPRFSRREDRLYPPLPKDLDLTNVIVTRCMDYGPITKLYPTLKYEKDPNTLIVTLDDDVKYLPTRIETLVQYAQQYPDSAIGGGGFIVGPWYRFFGMIHQPEKVTEVSVIEGWSGCAYRRRFFNSDLIDYKDAPKEAFYHDDVWISGYLALKKIPRLVHPEPIGSFDCLPNGLSANKIICAARFLPVTWYFKDKGVFDEEQVAPITATIGTYILLILIILLILLLAWFM